MPHKDEFDSLGTTVVLGVLAFVLGVAWVLA